MTQLLVPHSAGSLRRNNFDALRLGMALVVVWSHSFAIHRGSEATEPVSLLLGGVYNAGNIGVLAFFTISGFLITLSFERSSSAWSFMRRRVARIYPGYIVAALVCSLLIVPAYSSRPFGQLAGHEIAGLFSNLLLQNYFLPSDAFGGQAVNGSMWSIPYEFWCYIGVLGLGLTGLIRRRSAALLIALAVMAVRVWLDMTGRHPASIFAPIIGPAYIWFIVLPSFMLGAAIYQYRASLPRSAGIALGLIVATIASAHLPFADPARICVTRLLLPPTLAYLIFLLAFSDRLRVHNAARFGDFSYGTYLYAFPIQRMLQASLGDRLSLPGFVVASLVLSLLAGVLSWTLVEHWFLPRGRSERQPSTPPLQTEASLAAP